MNKKLAGLIKSARTNAGFTQQGLANLVTGLSASDLGKAERNEKDLTQEQLKGIAKATGVTQKSLLDAAGSSTKTTAATSSMKVTAAEKKLVELYRNASSEDKKAVMNILKGKDTSGNGTDILGTLLESAVGALIK